MVPGECEVQDIHGLWCSTSCRDFSKNNPKKHSTTILGDDDPGGGSVLTFNGLCDLMEMLKPDIVIWENVDDVSHQKSDGGSNLDMVLVRWHQLGYDAQVVHCNSKVYGLPENRFRCYIVALSMTPKTFTFQERGVLDVFRTFTEFLRVCHRKPQCL